MLLLLCLLELCALFAETCVVVLEAVVIVGVEAREFDRDLGLDRMARPLLFV